MSSARSSNCTLGLDVGGTKISAGIVTADGNLHDKITVPTPKGAPSGAVIHLLLDLISQLRDGNPGVAAVGVGAAGLVEWPQGIIRWTPNSGYSGVELRRLLEYHIGLPVVVDNDANTAALAEAKFGRGGPYCNMAFLTVGTGVGAGLIINGQIYRGRSGMAGELGHMVVNPGGERCGCGNQGCLEVMSSGTTLERLGRDILEEEFGDSSQITGRIVYTAARDGHSGAIAAFQKIGYWLGISVANIINVLDVEAVVVGGGLVGTGELLLEPVRRSAHDHTFARAHRTDVNILASTLGNDAGVIGAGHLALIQSRDQPEIMHPSSEQGHAISLPMAPLERDVHGIERVSEGAKALRRSIRNRYSAELTNPRVGFALIDLLQDLAEAAEAGSLDLVVQNSAIRAGAEIMEIEAQQTGLTQLARCGCGRHLRISAELLARAPINCGDCKEEFRIFAAPTRVDDVRDFATRVRMPSRGRAEHSP